MRKLKNVIAEVKTKIKTYLSSTPKDELLVELINDAERYHWLRDRMEIRMQEAVNGTKREALSLRIGFAFLDTPGPLQSSSSYHDARREKLDAAIDKARNLTDSYSIRVTA